MLQLEKYIGLLAGVVIGSAQIIYLFNTVRRKVIPSVLSWLGWAFLMGTSLVAQILTKGWQWSMTGILFSTIGCLTIAAVSFFSRNFSYRRADWTYLVFGGLCVGIYLLSTDPWITTGFAILADALLAIPTIRKAWKDPASEKSPAWILGVLSSTLALLICLHHDWLYALFPSYLFFFNGLMACISHRVIRRSPSTVPH